MGWDVWMGWIVIIGDWSSKSTFGANDYCIKAQEHCLRNLLQYVVRGKLRPEIFCA